MPIDPVERDLDRHLAAQDREERRQSAVEELSAEIQAAITLRMSGLMMEQSSHGLSCLAEAIESFDPNADEIGNLLSALAYGEGVEQAVERLADRLKANAYELATQKAEAIVDGGDDD